MPTHLEVAIRQREEGRLRFAGDDEALARAGEFFRSVFTNVLAVLAPHAAWLRDGRVVGQDGPYGPTVNSIASERLVVWLLVFCGSRYQSCA